MRPNPLAGLIAQHGPITSPMGDWLMRHAQVTATFAAPLQDSGNTSYRVRIGTSVFFVKTASTPEVTAYLDHPGRVALLLQGAALAHQTSDAVLPPYLGLVTSPNGPALVYEWVSGSLLNRKQAAIHARSGIDASAQIDPHTRFCNLPTRDRLAALTTIFRLHAELASNDWVACDFYDGSLLYDFDQRRMTVIDLDTYQQGPFTNHMGRMFGSSRFMAPEEFTLGARIDHRTTVYTLGRTALVFLVAGADAHAEHFGEHFGDLQLPKPVSSALCAVLTRATASRQEDRFAHPIAFYDAWNDALAH